MTFTNRSKNSTTFTNRSKNSTTFTNRSKSFAEDFLLKEDGGFLLQENGDKIILEQSSGWANRAKS